MRLEQSLPLLGGLLLCADKSTTSPSLQASPMPVEFQISSSVTTGTTAQQDDTEAQEGFLVEISGTTVTITCPLTEGSIAWHSTGTKGISDAQKYVIENHNSSPVNLSCSSGAKKYEMYLNAKVCANCAELDALAVTGIISADLLITFGVLTLVYYFSKDRKGRTSAGAGTRPRGQKMQRPPPVPNPDYEPIRKGQRDVYAGLESRGF